MSDAQLSAIFFLQMACILVVCRAVGWLARKVGQPLVVGEMVAGVLLGPSLLGLLLPSVQARLFPPESLKILYVTAQVGVGVYMFLIGLEFNKETLLKHARSAASVSIAGMVVPFVMGMALAVWLHKMPDLFSANVTQTVAMLFLGTSMSITAFPVLARIIYERGLLGTSLGTLTLAAGAVADAAAWCVLAVVLAAFGAGNGMAVRAMAGGLLFALLLATIGRKLLSWFSASIERAGKLSADRFALSLAGIMAAIWFTDTIGLHAVLGGFLLGLVMPRGLLAQELQQKLEPLIVVFLLPIFFAYSGLKTRLDLLANGQMLLVAFVILVAACAGKGIACWAAARFHGEDNRMSLAIAALMNCRGLMELIILNIGLQKGIIQQPLFSMMVLMALATTLMATPLFEWVYGRKARREGKLGEPHAGAAE